MEREQVKGAIESIINDILPEGTCIGIDPDKKLRDQLELDSMDFLDIMMELRKKYGIEVPETDYQNFATLNSSINYLESRMKNIT